MGSRRQISAFLLGWVLAASLLAQQTPRKKPVLIRKDATAEEAAEPEMVVPDAAQARENLNVGDFYFKRRNYKAAADRYRDAVKYAPSNAEPYEKLIRALEKLDDLEAAVQVCNDFIERNTGSKKVLEFEKKANELKARIG